LFNSFSNKDNDYPVLSIAEDKFSVILKKLETDVILCDSNDLNKKLAVTNKYNKSSLKNGIKIVIENDLPMLIKIKRVR